MKNSSSNNFPPGLNKVKTSKTTPKRAYQSENDVPSSKRLRVNECKEDERAVESAMNGNESIVTNKDYQQVEGKEDEEEDTLDSENIVFNEICKEVTQINQQEEVQINVREAVHVVKTLMEQFDSAAKFMHAITESKKKDELKTSLLLVLTALNDNIIGRAHKLPLSCGGESSSGGSSDATVCENSTEDVCHNSKSSNDQKELKTTLLSILTTLNDCIVGMAHKLNTFPLSYSGESSSANSSLVTVCVNSTEDVCHNGKSPNHLAWNKIYTRKEDATRQCS